MLQVMFAMSMIVFVVASAYLVKYWHETNMNGRSQEQVLDVIKDDSNKKSIEERYAEARKKYPDLIGRLIIFDGKKDYELPVMQTIKDPKYYLNRDTDGVFGKNNGTPFMDANCRIDKPTANFMIYAHHMRNGTQFGSLVKYEDKSYWEKHPIIKFETMYEELCDYEIVAAFRARVLKVSDKSFKYYKFFDAKNEEEYNAFIKGIKKMQRYDTGITPKYGEQLLTLSTCAYFVDDGTGRFAVVARKKGGSPSREVQEDNGLQVENLMEAEQKTPEPTKKPTRKPTKKPTKAPTPEPEPEPEPDPEPEPEQEPTPEPTEPPEVTYPAMTISPTENGIFDNNWGF